MLIANALPLFDNSASASNEMRVDASRPTLATFRTMLAAASGKSKARSPNLSLTFRVALAPDAPHGSRSVAYGSPEARHGANSRTGVSR